MTLVEKIGIVFKVLSRENSRIVHSVRYTCCLVVLPIISFLFFAVILSKGVPSDLPIAVLDEDHSGLSMKLVDMIDSTPTPECRYFVYDMNEAIDLMHKGKIYAIVQIPLGFQKNILGNKPAHVETYNSGANISANGLISKDIQTVVTSFSVGIQLQILQKQGLTAAQAMAQAMPVRFVKHVLFNPYINYGYYLAPCFMPLMLVMFSVILTIFAIGSELKYGTAPEWLALAKGSCRLALAGKLLMITLIMSILSVIMYFILFVNIGVPMNGNIFVLFISTILLILAYQAIAVFVIALTCNMRLALSVGGGYSVLAFTFSGLTFPIMAMDFPMQVMSCIFPFTHFMKIFVDQAIRGVSVSHSIDEIIYLLLFQLLVVFVLGRLRKVCTDKRYWGKI